MKRFFLTTSSRNFKLLPILAIASTLFLTAPRSSYGESSNSMCTGCGYISVCEYLPEITFRPVRTIVVDGRSIGVYLKHTEYKSVIVRYDQDSLGTKTNYSCEPKTIGEKVRFYAGLAKTATSANKPAYFYSLFETRDILTLAQARELLLMDESQFHKFQNRNISRDL